MQTTDPRLSIGGYQVTGTIGAGGMGVVYLAHHELLGRMAALKVLLPEYSHDQEVVARFFNEARASTAIKHPGIVRIYDFGYQADGSAFIAMEYLEGEPLDARLRRGALPALQALRFAGQMASALAAAHAHGIVHRDLKPANVFIVADPQVPGGERIKLLDFGIAKFAAPDDAGTRKTRAGAIMGSPAYMAPEQCRGLLDVDARADLYAVGCILFEMLCGRPPFDGGDNGPLAIMSAHLNDLPPMPSALRSDVPPELDAMVLYLLAKDPAQRYQSASDVGHALAGISGEQVSFTTLPGGPGEVTAPGTHTGIALSPTGEPLRASQIATLRTTGAPVARRRRAGAWIAGAAFAIAGIVAVAVLTTSDEVAPPPAAPVAIAPPAPAPEVVPERPRYTFQQLVATSSKRRAAATGTPVTTDEVQPVAWSWPPPSFADFFSSTYLRGFFGAFAVALAPPPRIITWRLASTPPGAQVLEGDTVVGTTPMEVSFEAMPGYVATLTLRLPGHEDAAVQLDGDADQDQGRELVPLVAVTVVSKPGEVTIVDAAGAERGVTPTTLELPRGSEALAFTLRRDGYEDLPVALVPDRERTERFALRAMVQVHVESVPPGARILKDGQFLGTAPYDDRFAETKARVEYTLELDGHRGQRVRVRGDRSASKTVTLRPEAPPVAKRTRRCRPAAADDGSAPSIVNPYDRC